MAFGIVGLLSPVLLRLFLWWKYTLVLDMCISCTRVEFIVLCPIWLTFGSHKLRFDPYVREGRQVKCRWRECIFPRPIICRWKWALTSQRKSSFLHLSSLFCSPGFESWGVWVCWRSCSMAVQNPVYLWGASSNSQSYPRR